MPDDVRRDRRCMNGGKPHDLAFGPVSVVAVGRLLEVSAVTAVRCDDRRDMRIAGDGGGAERRSRDEWIVRRGENQGGYANAVDDAQRAGAVVVVGRIAESMMRRRVDVVESPYAPDVAQ